MMAILYLNGVTYFTGCSMYHRPNMLSGFQIYLLFLSSWYCRYQWRFVLFCIPSAGIKLSICSFCLASCYGRFHNIPTSTNSHRKRFVKFYSIAFLHNIELFKCTDTFVLKRIIKRLFFLTEEKYTFLDTRSGYTPPQIVESSFKHYSDMTGENGPELINMTSSGGMTASSSLLQPDPFVDVTLQRTLERGGLVATLNNGGGVATLPRSSLAKRSENHVHSHVHSQHGTLLKRSVDELRTASPSGAVIVTSASVGGGTSATPDHLHHHEPS